MAASQVCAVATAGTLRFSVTYTGSGSYRTDYRSEPSNPGGAPDHNYASDSSRERWSLRFLQTLKVAACAGRRVCVSPATLTGARGTSSIAGRIDHVHIDGLYAFDNATLRCRVRAAPPRGAPLPVSVAVGAHGRSVTVTALDPLGQALLLLPANCPGQGDPLDGLADNYLQPGFSFAAGYGADRWFRSRTVAIGVRRLERVRRLTLHTSETRAGTPPRGCAVKHPAWEQCSTGGRWAGTITLTRIG